MRRQAWILLAIGIGLQWVSAPAGHARGYWDLLDGEAFDGLSQTVASFKDAVYISIAKKNPPGLTDRGQVLKTMDGENWTNVDLPSSVVFYELFQHGGSFYALGSEQSMGRIYRSNDGTVWSRVDDGQFASLVDNYAVSFKDHIYVPVNNGLLRSAGAGTPITWAQVPFPESNFVDIYLAPFNGKLFAAGVEKEPGRRTKIYETADGLTWSLSFQGDIEEPEPWSLPAGFAIKGNTLYWTVDELFYLESGSSEWQLHPAHGGVPLVLFDRLHAYTRYPQGIWALQPNNNWERVVDIGCDAINGMRGVAAVNGRTFVWTCVTYRIREGLVSLQQTPHIDQPLRFGEQNATLLSVKLNVNNKDTLVRLELENQGGAEQGTDITEMNLLRKTVDINGRPVIQKLASFTASPGARSWVTAPDFRTDVFDGDELVVVANIANGARHGAKVKMALKDIKWTTSRAYSYAPSSVTAPERLIEGAPQGAPDRIDGVLVFPSPARDLVTFAYDLDAASAVEIKIMDRNGELVSTITENDKPAGFGLNTTWDASAMAEGIYFATIRIKPHPGGERLIRKKVFIER